jgi:hypothetical protein
MTTTTVAERTSAPTEGGDFAARVEHLRHRETGDVRAALQRARREQQRWHLEELAATRVLDERDVLGRMPDPSISSRTAKANRETARALESLPEVAAAAARGDLTWDQLQPVAQLATPESDAEWSVRARTAAPADLNRMVRRNRRVTAADAEARHAMRSVVSWRDADGMMSGRWRLPDVDGVLVEKVLEHMAEQRRPARGERWDSLAHRKADALVDLFTNYVDVEPTGRFRIEIVEVRLPDGSASAECEGVTIAPETAAALRPNAKVRECRMDETGRLVTTRRPRPALPRDVERHVRRRDRQCRVPGCTAARGLQIHHLNPRCWNGDTTDVRELAAVCPQHHHLLEPHGPFRLVGDAEDPVGLRLVHRDDTERGPP